MKPSAESVGASPGTDVVSSDSSSLPLVHPDSPILSDTAIVGSTSDPLSISDAVPFKSPLIWTSPSVPTSVSANSAPKPFLQRSKLPNIFNAASSPVFSGPAVPSFFTIPAAPSLGSSEAVSAPFPLSPEQNVTVALSESSEIATSSASSVPKEADIDLSIAVTVEENKVIEEDSSLGAATTATPLGQTQIVPQTVVISTSSDASDTLPTAMVAKEFETSGSGGEGSRVYPLSSQQQQQQQQQSKGKGSDSSNRYRNTFASKNASNVIQGSAIDISRKAYAIDCNLTEIGYMDGYSPATAGSTAKRAWQTPASREGRSTSSLLSAASPSPKLSPSLSQLVKKRAPARPSPPQVPQKVFSQSQTPPLMYVYPTQLEEAEAVRRNYGLVVSPEDEVLSIRNTEKRSESAGPGSHRGGKKTSEVTNGLPLPLSTESDAEREESARANEEARRVKKEKEAKSKVEWVETVMAKAKGIEMQSRVRLMSADKVGESGGRVLSSPSPSSSSSENPLFRGKKSSKPF